KRRTHQIQYALEIKKLERIESKMLRAARAMLFVSEMDRASARRLAPVTPDYIVPNSTDLGYFHPNGRLAESATLLFTGTLSYVPNIEAVQYFIKEIFPRVRAAAPEVRLEIVGYNPTPEVCALANAHVGVVGSVPDVRPFFERATICIVPLKNGSGTRIKIIEAWAMQKAV